ncbi:MAG: helix-turn-helix transcriptional regulator [Spirochaetia bacterium]|nr:helix-turn-helix transcriptional regulator [Spirochaetia bacterium]
METSFRKNLRSELDYQGMPVKELAYKTGIPKRSIENYLSSRESLPPIDYAYKIAQVLQVSMEYLISGKDKTYMESGFAILKKVAAENKEYSNIFASFEKLSEDDIKMILDLIKIIVKHRTPNATPPMA